MGMLNCRICRHSLTRKNKGLIPIDTKERPVSPVNGVPLPEGAPPFQAGEQAREAGRKGGKKSAEKRAARKTLREELLALLGEQRPDKQGNMVQVQTAMSTALIKSALGGSVRAYEVIRDTIGEKPVDKVEASLTDSDFVLKIAPDELTNCQIKPGGEIDGPDD